LNQTGTDLYICIRQPDTSWCCTAATSHSGRL